MLARFTIAVLLLFWVGTSAHAQADPASLPARDAHNGLLVAADPYTEASRCKERFGKKNPYEGGILPVEVFFRNDNDKPIRVNLEAIRLLLSPPDSDRQRLAPLGVEDVADRVLNKGGPNPTTSRYPMPIPGRGPKTGRGKEWTTLETTLRRVALEMDILPPRSTTRGFLYFDMNRRYDWLPYARLYLPELHFVPDKKPLLFFEVSLRDAHR